MPLVAAGHFRRTVPELTLTTTLRGGEVGAPTEGLPVLALSSSHDRGPPRWPRADEPGAFAYENAAIFPAERRACRVRDQAEGGRYADSMCHEKIADVRRLRLAKFPFRCAKGVRPAKLLTLSVGSLLATGIHVISVG